MHDIKKLEPPATIGILGGGQLALMLGGAARALDYKVHIFCPDQDAPAAQIADKLTRAPYDDTSALSDFSDAVQAITYEFENIPAASLAALTGRKIAPPVRALQISQDRLEEKRFMRALGIGTAEFFAINDEADLQNALAQLRGDAILKTRRFGYDGKGQWRVRTGETPPLDLQETPCILEAIVPFEKEISVIVARTQNGACACYAAIENRHENHILRTSHFPATIAPALAHKAEEFATRLANALDYVGILAIEFFQLEDELLVNEIAPRVHNSGHLTQDACKTGQFEQHIRAICGLPLGDTSARAQAVMTNIIGDEIDAWRDFTSDQTTRVYLYGKSEARAGRKMGHITRLATR